MNGNTPLPRYRIGDQGAIRFHHRVIAHVSPYDTGAIGFCAAMVEAANRDSQCRAALKKLAVAVLTLQTALEGRGKHLPQPVVDAKDYAFKVLGITFS